MAVAAQALADRVLAILADVTGSLAVRGDPSLLLYESGLLDSLGTVTLMAMFEEELGVAISPAAFDREDWATPARMVADLQRRCGA
jgi:D-alanine--poly(phosphoribitol) ligase subunit 2